MTTIRDDIDAWARNTMGASAISGNEAAYNHLQTALLALKERPWASLVLSPDMDIPQPPQQAPEAAAAAGEGTDTTTAT